MGTRKYFLTLKLCFFFGFVSPPADTSLHLRCHVSRCKVPIVSLHLQPGGPPRGALRAHLLNMHHTCLSVCPPQKCRRRPPASSLRALFLSFATTNGLSSPCAIGSSQPLMAAADFTVSPPAIFLMMPLSNTVSQSSEEPSSPTPPSLHQSACCTHSFFSFPFFFLERSDGLSVLDVRTIMCQSREHYCLCLQRALTVKSIFGSF